jgi:3-oxoacyl-[acyl-carrier protein] reductase
MRHDLTQDFAGRTGAALVVGGSGSIGLAIVRMLAQRGADVALTYRSRPDAGEAAGRAFELDLSSGAACEEVVSKVVDEFGGLHTLVYAAGPHVPMKYLSQVLPDEMAGHLAADAAGFFSVVHPAHPTRRRGDGGAVVAVTTAATSRHPARDGLSATPKAAIESLVRGLAAEEGRYGVRVNAVGPGMLTDGMAARLMENGDLSREALDVARQNIPMRQFGTAHDVAEAVCFLASDRASFISGQKLDVDGGYSV